MDFTSLYKIKDKETRWVDIAFYVAALALIIAIVCYCIFAIKLYFLNRSIGQIDEKIAVYGSVQQKATEAEVFKYKKKIDDFATILANHKISSNVFNFIESHTLPNIWFSSFDMSSEINSLRLAGEAENMEALSKQFKLLEDSTEYVRNISVVNTQLGASGRISFVLDLFVTSRMFEYQAAPVAQLPAAQTP